MARIGLTNVSMSTIRDTLNNAGGSVDNTLGSFFKAAARINPWALYKPIAGGSDFYTIAEFESYAKSHYCGLTPKANNYLREANINYSGTKVAHDYDSVSANHLEWTYNRPTTKPFRLGDFRNYYPEAIPPDGGYKNYDFKKSYYTSVSGYSVSVKGSGADWYLETGTSTTARLSNLKIRTGLGSGDGVNQSGDMEIPINWIMSGIATDKWRFGIAVYISTLATAAKWQLFVSDWTFNKQTAENGGVSNTPYALPDMVTNQQACAQIANSTATEFPYVPVIVKNCYLGKDGSGMTYVYLTGDSQVYSTPSGSKGFKFNKLADTAADPKVNGNWRVESQFTGNYAQFGEATYQRVPVNTLVVYYNGTLSSATTIQVQVQYSYVTGLNSSGGFTTTTNTVLIERTFSAGTAPALQYIGEPGLMIVDSGTKWIKP